MNWPACRTRSSAARLVTRRDTPASAAARVADVAAKNADHSASSGATLGRSTHALVGRLRRRGRARVARTAAAARNAARCAWAYRSTGREEPSASTSPCRACSSRVRAAGERRERPSPRESRTGGGSGGAVTDTSASRVGAATDCDTIDSAVGKPAVPGGGALPPPRHRASVRTCVRHWSRVAPLDPVPSSRLLGRRQAVARAWSDGLVQSPDHSPAIRAPAGSGGSP